MNPRELTQIELQEVFEIVDGQLWRKVRVGKSGRKYPRKLVKNVVNTNEGYCSVNFKRRAIRYHRIVWTLTYGDIPTYMEVDHIDGNKVNNSITNLRLVTSRQNNQNQIRHRNGNLSGCSFHKHSGKWRARVYLNGKYESLGYYSTEQEAHEAYKTALSLEKKRA